MAVQSHKKNPPVEDGNGHVLAFVEWKEVASIFIYVWYLQMYCISMGLLNSFQTQWGDDCTGHSGRTQL